MTAILDRWKRDFTKGKPVSPSEKWEKDYLITKEALLKNKDFDEKLKSLELDLSKLIDDGTLDLKKRKYADLLRSRDVRQQGKGNPLSAMSSSSSNPRN